MLVDGTNIFPALLGVFEGSAPAFSLLTFFLDVVGYAEGLILLYVRPKWCVAGYANMAAMGSVMVMSSDTLTRL